MVSELKVPLKGIFDPQDSLEGRVSVLVRMPGSLLGSLVLQGRIDVWSPLAGCLVNAGSLEGVLKVQQ